MRDDTKQLVEDFLEFIKDELQVSELPEIKFVGKDFSDAESSFGQWDGQTIKVVLKGRHPMDVLRTLAHEIIHQVKNHTDGSDGSEDENEANALAGKFMRKFGKTRKHGFGLMPESLMLLEAMFGDPRTDSGVSNFVNQGVTRDRPGMGPETTADSDPSARPVGPGPEEQGPVTIELVPNGVSNADLQQMFAPLRQMDPDLFEKMTNLEAVSTVSLDPDQLHLLASVVEEFLAARKYNKPKKAFAEDLISKLNMNIGPNGMFESLYGAGENEEGFERQSMERKVPSMNEVFIWETSPQVKDMKKAVNSMEKTRDLKKASAKEKKEHPWATKKQATQIAIDHAKEGKP